MESLAFIGLIIICFICFMLYNAIQMCRFNHKFSNFRNYCDLYQYIFVGYYQKRGIIYRKKIFSYQINNLLEKYGFPSISFPKECICYEYIALIDFNRNLRFYHFYSLYVKGDNNEYIDISNYNPFLENKGIIFRNMYAVNGDNIDIEIQFSMKESLDQFIRDYKEWVNDNDNNIFEKFDDLIQIFKNHQKDLIVRDYSSYKVTLVNDNDNNLVTIQILKEEDASHINQFIKVIITRIKEGTRIIVEKLFSIDSEVDIIFYTISNEFTKEEIKSKYKYNDSFMQGISLPSTRLLSDSEITTAMMQYSSINFIEEEIPTTSTTDIDLIPLTEFEEFYGNLKEAHLVNNQTGELYTIYVATVPEWTDTYVCYSPYLGKVKLSEIKDKRESFFIACKDAEGIYFLCNKESIKLREESENWEYAEKEGTFEDLLKELNIEGKMDNYTIELKQ